MTTRNHTEDFYAPAMAVTTDEPGPIQRFLRRVYRVHRLRGAVSARNE